MRGREVENPHPAITMFSMCSAMKWNHLPVAGGIYDQHPEFLEKMRYIFGEQMKQEAAERRKQEAESKRKSGTASKRGRRR